MKKQPLPQQRQFLGKTSDFKNKAEKTFYQRMLKAYLKGHQYFHFGFEYVGLKRFPKKYPVLQKP